jgi:CRISPR/Cas system-associated exonuclease Cas4 (RecB family)
MFIDRIGPSKSDIIDQCLLKYYYRYIIRIPGNKAANQESLNFGSFIHKVFELGSKARHIKELEKIVSEQRGNYHIPFSMNNSIKVCIENFIRLNAKLGDPQETELEFKIEITDGIVSNGIIDRINTGKEGGILVIDYKTSKREKTKKELILDKQLRCYANAAHSLFNVPYNKIHCGHYYPLSDNLVTVQFPNSLVESWKKEEINKVWRIRKKKKSEFPAMENQFCDWCEFKEMCTRFNTQENIDKLICEQLALKEKLKLDESSASENRKE